jgi:hypothetical protein
MGQMELVILAPILRCKELLKSKPHGLDGVGVCPRVRIDERDRVIYGAVRVTDGSNIPVRSPAIADDSSARFDPGTYQIHQYVGESIRYGNNKCSTGFTFKTAKYPLYFYRVSPVVFALTVLALIDFDGLVRTADLFRAALQNTNIGSLQNIPQSAIVVRLK